MALNDYVGSVSKPYKSAYEINNILEITSTRETIHTIQDGKYVYEFTGATNVEVIAPNNKTTQIASNEYQSGSIILSLSGTYHIRYSGKISKHDVTNGYWFGTNDYSISFYISVVENKLPLKKWTVTDVVNRLLDLAEPIRKGEVPRFRFNSEQAAQFDKVLSPQFSFTKETLRECLQEVGRFIHGEPRLTPKNDYVLVDEENFYRGRATVGIAGTSYPYYYGVNYVAYIGGRSHKVILDSEADGGADEYFLTVEGMTDFSGPLNIYNADKLDKKSFYYEVSFEMYARQDQASIYTRPYIKETVSQLIDSYTSYLDSNAENLVNQLDKYSGVIVEPYRDGAQSVRTENAYVRIEESNMLIATRYPIYSVDKLEYIYTQDGTVKSVDISPYLFEKSVYDSQLSSYAEQYPYSKAYGLYYSQGSKNIGGLNFHVDAAAAGVFKEKAINNILQQAAGITVGSNDYPTMAFRVTYTPFYNARVAQTKSYYEENLRPAALIYNQQANVVESRYYGENLKGAIARLGNIDKSLTYILYNVNQIPKAGQMFDRNYYISAVAVAMYPTCFLVTIGLSKDFNRISAYIGINSEKRYSEISQNQAVERNTLYREYIVVGEQETPDKDCLTGNKLLAMIADTFYLKVTYENFSNGRAALGANLNVIEYKFGTVYTVEINGELINAILISEADGGSDDYYLKLENSTASGKGKVIRTYSKTFTPLSNVCAWGTTFKGNDLNAVNLPVISSAFGNSISFSWQYADNYSAGAAAVHQSTGNVTGYFQSDVSYTDYYGRMYYYNFDLQAEGPTVTADNITAISQNLPNGTKPTQSSEYVSTIGQQPYIIRKDNREALQINFQIDFVANLENLIIGSALASYCSAVRGSNDGLEAKLYVFPTELNKFTDHVEAYETDIKLADLPSAEIYVSMFDGYFTVGSSIFPANGKSWAIVTNQQILPSEEVEDEFGNVSEQQSVYGGDLLIGQNIEVTAGQAFTPIYFTKKREIFDKTVWKDRL